MNTINIVADGEGKLKGVNILEGRQDNSSKLFQGNSPTNEINTSGGYSKVIVDSQAKISIVQKNTRSRSKLHNDKASFRPKELKLFEPDLNQEV